MILPPNPTDTLARRAVARLKAARAYARSLRDLGETDPVLWRAVDALVRCASSAGAKPGAPIRIMAHAEQAGEGSYRRINGLRPLDLGYALLGWRLIVPDVGGNRQNGEHREAVWQGKGFVPRCIPIDCRREVEEAVTVWRLAGRPL